MLGFRGPSPTDLQQSELQTQRLFHAQSNLERQSFKARAGAQVPWRYSNDLPWAVHLPRLQSVCRG